MNELSRGHGLFTSILRRNAATLCRLASPAVIAALTALFSPTATVQAQISPVGPWDFSVHGDTRGVALIEFFGDGTLTGDQIVAPPGNNGGSSGGSDNPRNSSPVVGDPRTGDAGDDNGGGGDSTTNSFGGASIEGAWTFDSRGNVIGYYSEFSLHYNETNFTRVTNIVSFRAVIRPNKMVLRAYGPGTKFLLKGTRSGSVPDISGSFFASGRKDDGPFVEFFTLTPGASANSYDLVGTGPSYDISGSAILTSSGHLAVLRKREDNKNILSVTGKFNTLRNTGVLKGSATGNNKSVRYTVNKM